MYETEKGSLTVSNNRSTPGGCRLEVEREIANHAASLRMGRVGGILVLPTRSMWTIILQGGGRYNKSDLSFLRRGM